MGTPFSVFHIVYINKIKKRRKKALEINKKEALKQIQSRCDLIKRYIKEMNHSPVADKQVLTHNTNEFLDYFKNAIESADPFIQNVNAMRAQGLWLPDKINNSSVKAAYYNLAKGYARKIINNPNAEHALCSADREKIRAIYNIEKDIEKYIDDIIEGRTIINET